MPAEPERDMCRALRRRRGVRPKRRTRRGLLVVPRGGPLPRDQAHHRTDGLPIRSSCGNLRVRPFKPYDSATMALHIQTPLVTSRPLSLACGRAVDLKLDALQPPGSFKMRGIGHACETYRARGARRFVSSSGGNAGLAVAYAGRELGCPSSWWCPRPPPSGRSNCCARKRRRSSCTASPGRKPTSMHNRCRGETDAFLHPFDDPLLWQGHATMIDEVARSGVKPDAVVLSVGGGGLLCGVAEGLHRNGWDRIPILAVETEGAASFHAAMQAGSPVELDAITSVATSLGAKRVCDQAMRWSRETPIQSVLVSDMSALSACERVSRRPSHACRTRMWRQPRAGLRKGAELEPFNRFLVVVCGGATATIDQIRAWREKGA